MSFNGNTGQSILGNNKPERATVGGITLRIELIILIGEFLAGSHALKSLASLNVVNREVHEELLPILYETLVWDTETAWWILDRGHVPSGWKWTKYLVTMEDTTDRLEHYLKAVTTRGRSTTRDSDVFAAAFPQLAVVFVKALPKTSQFDMRHIFIDISIRVYKPVNMHILLTASTTSDMASETTFLGANVQPSSTRHGPRYCERISKLTLGKGAYIRRSRNPVVFPVDSGAVHKRDPDFQLSMHMPRMLGDRPPTPRQSQAKETFEALLSALPARKGNSDLCHVKLKRLNVEIDMLYGAIVHCLKDHVKISVTLDYGADAVKLFKIPMTRLAEQYLAAWDRLGPIATEQEFFRIDFTDVENPHPGYDDPDLEDYDESTRREYIYIASLKTLPARPSAPGRISGARQAPEGFEIVIKRIEIWNEDDWNEDDEEAEIMFRKKYLTR